MDNGVTITKDQIRGARGLLNWTVRDLAEKAHIHRNTITNIETGKYAGEPETLSALRAALETGGIEFIDPNGGGPGARLRR